MDEACILWILAHIDDKTDLASAASVSKQWHHTAMSWFSGMSLGSAGACEALKAALTSPSASTASLERFIEELWPRCASCESAVPALEHALRSVAIDEASSSDASKTFEALEALEASKAFEAPSKAFEAPSKAFEASNASKAFDASSEAAMTVVRKLFARNPISLARAVEVACTSDQPSMALAMLRLKPSASFPVCLVVAKSLARRGDFKRVARLVSGDPVSGVDSLFRAARGRNRMEDDSFLEEHLAEKALDAAVEGGHEDFVRAFCEARLLPLQDTVDIVARDGTPALFRVLLRSLDVAVTSNLVCVKIVAGDPGHALEKLRVLLQEAPLVGLGVFSLDASEAALRCENAGQHETAAFIRSAEFSALFA